MEDASRPIRIVVINGSVRPGNYTAMASAYVVDELKKNPRVSVDVVHPAELQLPFPGTNPDAPDTRKLQQLVREATGVVLVTPEYHGSFSSVMKLVIENLGFPSVLAGKPVALLGVAAGSIGAINRSNNCAAWFRTSAPSCCRFLFPSPTCRRFSIAKAAS